MSVWLETTHPIKYNDITVLLSSYDHEGQQEHLEHFGKAQIPVTGDIFLFSFEVEAQ